MSDYNTMLRLCLQRDRRAQLEFYMHFYKSVYNSCFRILGNPQEAEDVMQETFLKVFDKIESLHCDESGMERILKRIAINQSIDLFRKRKILFTDLNEETDYPGEETAPEEIELQLEAVHRMMKLLPEGYRMILNLKLVEGLDYEDIASQLQISSSTVRSQFTRARQRLIQLIKEHYSYESLIQG